MIVKISPQPTKKQAEGIFSFQPNIFLITGIIFILGY